MLKSVSGSTPPPALFLGGFGCMGLGGWLCSFVVFGGGFAGLSGGSLL